MQLFTHVYRRDWSPDWEVVARSVSRTLIHVGVVSAILIDAPG